ncbi:MAG: tRNA 2-thiouridine(34) synthase MnmA [Actinomycetales bacterium]|nr:tRNA 2-thiouridine(34) synthase MnmA [Actinomycetales bacterium]
MSSERRRIVAALSGGVDSAVAAARLVDAGHEVTGVHLALARDTASDAPGSAPGARPSRGCCTAQDARDAARIADVLGIAFYVWDVSEAFEREVIADFLTEYARGRTPHPCARCNERIKFATVLNRAIALGFDALATGHYARIEPADPATGRGPTLHRGADPGKDQSYVLAMLTADQLATVVLPLGDAHKDEVRREAARRGLTVAAKPDSHDICFIPQGSTRAWLAARLPARPGRIVDGATGRILGEVADLTGLTVGQRRGVGLPTISSDQQRRYVTAIDVATATVTVGALTDSEVTLIVGGGAQWCGPAPGVGWRGRVQVRAHGETTPAVLTDVGAGRTVLTCELPVRGIAPGQLAVLYEGTRVVGSFTMDRSAPGVAPAAVAADVVRGVSG